MYPTVCIIDSCGKLLHRTVLCDDLMGRMGGGREALVGGDICICIADSLSGTAEINTML